MAVGYFIVIWAMRANKYFSTLVRIQDERGHKAVTAGPYRFVRHPGYLGMILLMFSNAAIPGSLYGLIPAAAYMIVLIVRTSLEDRTLQKELDGYAEYASNTKYKLLPPVW